MVAGAVFGLQAIVKTREERAQCGGGPTCGNAGAVHEMSEGGSFADAATALVPVGLAAAAAGVFLMVTAHGSFEPSVGPRQARLDATWSW